MNLLSTNYMDHVNAKYCIDNCFFDKYFFNPLSDLIMNNLRSLNITPNQVTYLSTLSTIISFYFYLKNIIYLSVPIYIFGYYLDCVDGRYARKYKLTSCYGMMIDQVSDVLTNIPYLFVMCIRCIYNLQIIKMILIIIVTKTFTLSFSFEESYSNIIKNDNDNFYLTKKKILDDEEYNHLSGFYLLPLYLIFNYINYYNYNEYKKYYNYSMNLSNEPFDKISFLKSSILKLKEFGAGNYCIFMAIMMLY